MVLKEFSSLRPGTVFCMVSFMGKNVSWHAAKIENQGHSFCKKCLHNRCSMTIYNKDLSFTMEIFHKFIEFIIRNERKLLFHVFKLGIFCKITQNGTFFHITKNLIQIALNMY